MGKMTMKIRRKKLVGSFTDTFRELFPPPAREYKLPRSYGILTASNTSHFTGLQLLLASISQSHEAKILFFALGLTAAQSVLCRKNGAMVKKFELPESRLSYFAAGCKPFYVKSSPFRNTIWIYADAMVQGDLRELVELSQPSALFTTDHSHLRDTTLNQFTLYEKLQITKCYRHDIPPYLNTGVFVVNRTRDAQLIDDWCHIVEQANHSVEVAQDISCWDQGACKWAIQKNELLYLIVPDKRFNFPAKVRHYAYPIVPESVNHLFRSVKESPCLVNHWMGGPKPWAYWGEMLDLSL